MISPASGFLATKSISSASSSSFQILAAALAKICVSATVTGCAIVPPCASMTPELQGLARPLRHQLPQIGLRPRAEVRDDLGRGDRAHPEAAFEARTADVAGEEAGGEQV